MFVKICGITRLEDAEAAAQCGASAVGFVFWPDSPRFLDPYRARAIAAALPLFVTTVGVFVNQPLEYVAGVASLVHLGAVQLHGDETMAYASRIRPPVVKAIPLRESFDVASAERWPRRSRCSSTSTIRRGEAVPAARSTGPRRLSSPPAGA